MQLHDLGAGGAVPVILAAAQRQDAVFVFAPDVQPRAGHRLRRQDKSGKALLRLRCVLRNAGGRILHAGQRVPNALRHDRHAGKAFLHRRNVAPGEEREVRIVRDRNAGRVDQLAARIAIEQRKVLHGLERELHIPRRERRSVVEIYVVPQRQRPEPGPVRGGRLHRVFLTDAVDVTSGLDIGIKERIVQKRDRRGCGIRFGGVRIERRRRFGKAEAEHRLTALRFLRFGTVAARADRRRERENKKQYPEFGSEKFHIVILKKAGRRLFI